MKNLLLRDLLWCIDPIKDKKVINFVQNDLQVLIPICHVLIALLAK